MKNVARQSLNSLMLLTALAVSGACGVSPSQVREAELKYEVSQKFLASGEMAQAMANAMESVKINPKNAEAQSYLGLLYMQNSRFAEAETHFKRAVALDPKSSETHNNLCALYSEQGKYETALTACDKALTNYLYATPERAHHNKGLIYGKMNQKQKSKESFERALRSNAKFVMSLRALGEQSLSEKKLDEAQKHLSQAAKVCMDSPAGAWGQECPQVHYQLALTYLQLKKREDAVASFRECIRSDEPTSTTRKKCSDNLKLYH